MIRFLSVFILFTAGFYACETMFGSSSLLRAVVSATIFYIGCVFGLIMSFVFLQEKYPKALEEILHE